VSLFPQAIDLIEYGGVPKGYFAWGCFEEIVEHPTPQPKRLMKTGNDPRTRFGQTKPSN
jgi:hypothetical protein